MIEAMANMPAQHYYDESYFDYCQMSSEEYEHRLAIKKEEAADDFLDAFKKELKQKGVDEGFINLFVDAFNHDDNVSIQKTIGEYLYDYLGSVNGHYKYGAANKFIFTDNEI